MRAVYDCLVDERALKRGAQTGLVAVAGASTQKRRVPRARAWGRRRRLLCLIGTAVIGLPTTTMPFADMSGSGLPDALTGDRFTLVAAATIGCTLAATACPLGLRLGGTWSRILSAWLRVLSICMLTGTGTSAIAHGLQMTPVHETRTIATGTLDVLVAGFCLLLLLAGAACGLARAGVRRRAGEAVNPQDLADIAVEGLLVCRGEKIVYANASFLAMTGIAASAVVGMSIRSLFAHTTSDGREAPDESAERLLNAAGGETIPVEVVRRSIRYAGVPHDVIAIRDLRERRKLEEEVRCLALRDSLTDVANRQALGLQIDRELQEQERRGEIFSLLTIDLERFRSVTETHGHRIGDLLIRQVARRLKATVRATDMVARRNSAAFTILATAPMTPDDAATMARRIVEVIRRPFLLEGKVVTIGTSIGVVMAPQDGRDQATLLHNADLALGQAKDEGRNTVRFFETAMDMRVRARGSLELDLRRALAEDQIKVFYQPLFDVSRQQVRGFEALVRWESPERGLVMPNDFIALAEETGLIVEIGERVLELATRQAAEWGNGMTIAVNLSAVQFGATDLVETVETALRSSGLEASRLELEITESVLLKEDESTMNTLHALRNLGVRISMDDFGTGYSSLRYLRSFPFDKIKIDRSFVQEMLASKESSAIIRAVLGLGQRLGIATTAEGVETLEQREYLEQEGCDVLQGYLIGRPVSPDEAARFIRVATRADD